MSKVNATELNDNVWGKIEKILREDKQNWRGNAESKRLFINGVLTLLNNKKKYSTCLNWSNLEQKYGNPNAQQRRFNHWRNKGVWEKLLPIFAGRADYCWVARNGTYEILLKNGKLIRDINEDNEKRFSDYFNNKEKEYKKEIQKLKMQIKQMEQKINSISLEFASKVKNSENKYKEILKDRNKIAKKTSKLSEQNKQLKAILKANGYEWTLSKKADKYSQELFEECNYDNE